MKRSLLASVVLAASTTASPLCKGDDGVAVDMWLALKGPTSTSYDYWAPSSTIAASSHSLNATSVGALGATISQLWASSTIEYLIWNDEPVGMVNYNYTTGHTKGIWAWNPTSGDAIILQHSIPLYPAGPGQTSKYSGLGTNAYTYGQHAFCFHTTVDALEQLATLAPLTIPSIYDQRISANTPSALSKLANGAYSTSAQCKHTSFLTQGGVNVTYFAKSTQWDSELYADCIAPTLRTSLAAETWQHGTSCGPSCGTREVVDIEGVSYPGGLSFTNYNDHSKWATSTNAGDNWFCPSDINRVTSQAARGGAAYCFQDSGLAPQMQAAITSSDSC